MIRLAEVIKTTPPELIGNVQSFESGWMAACRFIEMNIGRAPYKTQERKKLKAPVVIKRAKP